MFLPCRDSNLPWKIGFHLTMEWLVSWPLKNNLMAGKILILRRHLYLVFWDHWDHFLSMSQENVFQITNPPVLLTVRYWKLPFSSLISLLKMLIFRSLCEFTRGYPMNHIYIYIYIVEAYPIDPATLFDSVQLEKPWLPHASATWSVRPHDRSTPGDFRVNSMEKFQISMGVNGV